MGDIPILGGKLRPATQRNDRLAAALAPLALGAENGEIVALSCIAYVAGEARPRTIIHDDFRMREQMIGGLEVLQQFLVATEIRARTTAPPEPVALAAPQTGGESR